jgi:hypothetical protein
MIQLSAPIFVFFCVPIYDMTFPTYMTSLHFRSTQIHHSLIKTTRNQPKDKNKSKTQSYAKTKPTPKRQTHTDTITRPNSSGTLAPTSSTRLCDSPWCPSGTGIRRRPRHIGTHIKCRDMSTKPRGRTTEYPPTRRRGLLWRAKRLTRERL